MSDSPAKARKVIGGDELRPSGRALVGDIVISRMPCGHVVRQPMANGSSLMQSPWYFTLTIAAFGGSR